MNNIQRLPKRANEFHVPKKVKDNGIDYAMDFYERRPIVTKNVIDWTKKQYERMGIIIVDEYNNFFWNVILPEGWEIKDTDPSMWFNLYDNKGRQRANFFFKDEYYEMDAFINFDTRYQLSVDHLAEPGTPYEIWRRSDFQGFIKDGNEIVFRTVIRKATGKSLEDLKAKEILEKQLRDHMKEFYPEYQDINAYWD